MAADNEYERPEGAGCEATDSDEADSDEADGDEADSDEADSDEADAEATAHPLHDYFARAVFATREREHTWADVLLFATLTGAWASFLDDVRRGLACWAKLEDEDLDPPSIDAAAKAWIAARSLRDVATAKVWLAAREMSDDDWLEHLGRAALRALWQAELPAISEAHPIDDDEVTAVLRAEALCSGKLDDLARDLALHEALADRALTEGASPPTDEEIDAVVAETSIDVDQRLPGLDPAEAAERVRRLAATIALVRRTKGALIARAALEEHVRAHAIEWVTLRGSYMIADDIDVAREAAMCLREDGMDIAEVAAASRAELHRDQLRIEEIPPELQGALLGARGGDVLGPALVEGRYVVIVVDEKTIPSLDDPATLRLAQERVVDATARRAMNERIRWLGQA